METNTPELNLLVERIFRRAYMDSPDEVGTWILEYSRKHYTADLLAKVSEQEKEIERLKSSLEQTVHKSRLSGGFLDAMLTIDDQVKTIKEQAARIQLLGGAILK